MGSESGDTLEFRSYNGHRIACAVHDAGAQMMVIFCHGFRGTNTGPSRSFVTAARRLAAVGISSLRFDQYGSGNSDGDFQESSFDDWVRTTEAIARDYLSNGFKVAIFGQSMGAAASIVVGARVPALSAIVAWVPDPNVDETPATEEVVEEGGQLVHSRYWREAANARVDHQLSLIQCPVYIVQCTEDELVNATNRAAIEKNARRHHTVETLNGLPHSAWTHDEFQRVIHKSVAFLAEAFDSNEA